MPFTLPTHTPAIPPSSIHSFFILDCSREMVLQRAAQLRRPFPVLRVLLLGYLPIPRFVGPVSTQKIKKAVERRPNFKKNTKKEMDRTTEADECGICFDGLVDAVPLVCCSQRVCKRCYVKILAAHPHCPYCAARLPVPRPREEVNAGNIDMSFCAIGAVGVLCCLLGGSAISGMTFFH